MRVNLDRSSREVLLPRSNGKRAKLAFVPPSDLIDDRLPGARGELLPLKSGQVLLVAHYPGDTTDEALAWVQKACRALVDDGVADAAVYLPDGWKIDIAFVEED